MPGDRTRTSVLRGLVPPLVHKLNNAIGGVAGLAELLARAPDPATTPRFAETIGSQARAALELLGTLAEFARDEPQAVEPVDVAEVARRAQRFLEPLAEARATELEVRAPETGAVARTDPRALLGDLSVAVGATLIPLAREGGSHRRGRISIRTGHGGLRVSLVLTAAAPESLATALPSRARVRGNLTRVVWDLEADGEAAPPAPADPALDSTAGPRGASILLSESDPQLADLLTTVLGEAGHRVAPAAGTFDLERQAERFEADLVLLESAADGLGSGPDPTTVAGLAERLRGAGHAVALLGRPSPPGLPHLDKPFRPGELIGFVDELLASRAEP